jgi:hypothetical protein
MSISMQSGLALRLGAAIFVNIIVFVVLQAATVRIVRPQRLLVSSALAFVASLALTVGPALIAARPNSWTAIHVLEWALVVGIGSVGLCGLYVFLGPATADRSATAHLLAYLARNGGEHESAAVVAAFDRGAFVRKRFAECEAAGILSREGSHVALTRKGRAIATIFSGLSSALEIEKLPGYSFSFNALQGEAFPSEVDSAEQGPSQ